MKLVIDDLSSIIDLFVLGVVAGALLSAVPFILGYTINALHGIIKRG